MIDLMVRDDLTFSELNCLHVLAITELGSVELKSGQYRHLPFSVMVTVLLTELFLSVFVVDLPLYSSAIFAHLVLREQWTARMIPFFSLFTFLDKISLCVHFSKVSWKGQEGKHILKLFSVSSCWLLVAMFLDHCYLFLLHLFACRSAGIASCDLVYNSLCSFLFFILS